MHEAGLLFHSWGVALGLKLEQILGKKQNFNLSSIEEENDKTFLTQLKEQMDEDYLDEGKNLVEPTAFFVSLVTKKNTNIFNNGT